MSEQKQRRRQRGEGSLFQRASDGKWVGRVELGWIDGERRRKTVYGDTMNEARKKLDKVKVAVAAGDRTTAGISVKHWVTAWLEEVCPAKDRMRPKTLANYESYARNYIVPCLGPVKLDKLGAQHFRQLRNYVLGKGLSSTTAGHAHTIFSTSLNDAVKEGLLVKNPAELADRPANADSQRRALTIPEVQRISWELDDPAWIGIVSRWLAALLLGMRQGECLGLQVDKVDMGNESVTVDTQLQRIPWTHGCQIGELGMMTHSPPTCPARRLRTLPGYSYRPLKGNLCLVAPKTEGSKRLVPMPAVLASAMAQHFGNTSHWPNPHGLVWRQRNGDPIDPGKDREQWHQLLAAAGVDDTDQHSARHTTSTLLLALGVSDDVRMAILGHSTAAARQAYTHVDLSLAREAMAKLQGAVVQLDRNSHEQRGTIDG